MTSKENFFQMDRDDVLSLSRKHNFWTWSVQDHVEIIPVEKAEGVYFWDYDGKKYLDFNSMVMCVNIGHGNQKVINAISDQVRELSFAGPHMATKPRATLGKMLAEIMPGNLDHFLYTLGGSDANENAVKIARSVSGKFKILTRYRSYHGATMGAIALTGDRRRLAWEPNVMP
ncbi:MAG: aminotransferase class III-fold pyridoxal phosphate-dependent enzyme, partial [Anaerolineaceae bacterium]|nr:aminotransferase class III-fold pyridoxal phosphate-dependent enzyme [Anaerolineaceae bacterium]